MINLSTEAAAMLHGKLAFVLVTSLLFLTVANAPKAAEQPQRLITPMPGMEFVYIPPGDFLMGSPEKEKGREEIEKQFRVTISRGFYMQTKLVTLDQWRAFIRETGYESIAGQVGCMVLKDNEWMVRQGFDWSNPGFSQDGDHPVTCVSWKDARAFAEWLSNKVEGTFRLPTEAEWEYACRAGTTTRFNWGDGIDCAKANFGNSWTNECGRKERLKTVSVATYAPNPWGLFDMHGNLWEWTNDWHGPYPEGAATDPTGPEWGDKKSVRGGSWWSYSRFCRSASRAWNSPDNAFQTLGFRLVAIP